MPRRDYDDDYDDRDHDRYDRGDDRSDRRRRRYDDEYDDDEYEFGRRRRFQEPHRATVVLVLGICGLIVCGICAPIAWSMGSQDLNKMRAGTMDPSGYGSTKAGYVLGIIGTMFILLGIVGFIVLLALDGAK